MHLSAGYCYFHGAAGCVRARHILVFYVMYYSTTIVLNVCVMVLVASANTAGYCTLVKITAVPDSLILLFANARRLHSSVVSNGYIT